MLSMVTRMNHSNENQELAELRQGDAAVADVFGRYRERLERMIRLRMDPRLLGRIDTDDVLQDAWITVSRRIHEYIRRPDVPFFIWLRQITRQALVDLHRQHLGAQMRNARLEVSLQRPGGDGATSITIAAQLVGAITSPSRAATRVEEIAHIRGALDEMDNIDREVLVLRHLEGLGNNETAQVLNLDPSAASKRYLRAIQRLTRLLSALQNHSEN